MKKIYKDFIGIIAFISIVLLIWSNATSDTFAKGLLIFMFVGLFLINIYFMFKRDMSTVVERIAYLYSFISFTSIVTALLIIDDNPIMSGIHYLLIAAMVVSLLSFITIKWSYLTRFSLRKQNLIMWSISIVFVVIGFATVI